MKLLNQLKAESILSKYFSFEKSKMIDLNSYVPSKYPFYLKYYSEVIIHKKDANAIFKINNLSDFNVAKRKILDIQNKYLGFAYIQDVFFGSELILGIKRDIKFGYMMMIGIGGSNSESLRDVEFRKIPLNKQDVLSCLSNLRNDAIILNIDKKAFVNFVLSIQDIYKLGLEMEINPIIIDKDKINIADLKIYA